ncbi:translation initiation factor IF-2-like [Falco peregrinus]|uniref:translation initiation factor IF-2-like n=1 Tax=Falco peregrinus TaxID=8954 RepID=UPI00247A42FA|nr:translation initiation factor IF-2-like [Falco peregrinus]
MGALPRRRRGEAGVPPEGRPPQHRLLGPGPTQLRRSLPPPEAALAPQHMRGATREVTGERGSPARARVLPATTAAPARPRHSPPSGQGAPGPAPGGAGGPRRRPSGPRSGSAAPPPAPPPVGSRVNGPGVGGRGRREGGPVPFLGACEGRRRPALGTEGKGGCSAPQPALPARYLRGARPPASPPPAAAERGRERAGNRHGARGEGRRGLTCAPAAPRLLRAAAGRHQLPQSAGGRCGAAWRWRRPPSPCRPPRRLRGASCPSPGWAAAPRRGTSLSASPPHAPSWSRPPLPRGRAGEERSSSGTATRGGGPLRRAPPAGGCAAPRPERGREGLSPARRGEAAGVGQGFGRGETDTSGGARGRCAAGGQRWGAGVGSPAGPPAAGSARRARESGAALANGRRAAGSPDRNYLSPTVASSPAGAERSCPAAGQPRPLLPSRQARGHPAPSPRPLERGRSRRPHRTGPARRLLASGCPVLRGRQGALAPGPAAPSPMRS